MGARFESCSAGECPGPRSSTPKRYSLNSPGPAWRTPPTPDSDAGGGGRESPRGGRGPRRGLCSRAVPTQPAALPSDGGSRRQSMRTDPVRIGTLNSIIGVGMNHTISSSSSRPLAEQKAQRANSARWAFSRAGAADPGGRAGFFWTYTTWCRTSTTSCRRSIREGNPVR